MSQVSEAIKAKRKQHRQDHATSADRLVNQNNRGDVQGRKAARKENFSAQGNKGASDFNFDQHGKGHISQQEINHLRDSGQSRDQIMAAVKANGGELGKNVQSRFDRWGAAKEKAQAVKENPVTNNNGSNNDVDGTGNAVGNGNTAVTGNTGDVTGEGNAVGIGNTAVTGNTGDVTDSPGAAVGIGNVAAGGNEVNGSGNATGIGNNANTQEDMGNMTNETTQDNDQANSIVGDNNYQYNNQDNSVRNYGGDTRVFNYQSSGGNPALDTPASAATMGGFYAPDDSHGAIAARVDRNQTLNADAQKKYQDTSYIAQGAISRASNNSYIDPNALDARIQARTAASRARATTMGANLFGDQGAFQLPDWQDPDPQKPVEDPDFEKMANIYGPS